MSNNVLKNENTKLITLVAIHLVYTDEKITHPKKPLLI